LFRPASTSRSGQSVPTWSLYRLLCNFLFFPTLCRDTTYWPLRRSCLFLFTRSAVFFYLVCIFTRDELFSLYAVALNIYICILVFSTIVLYSLVCIPPSLGTSSPPIHDCISVYCVLARQKRRSGGGAAILRIHEVAIILESAYRYFVWGWLFNDAISTYTVQRRMVGWVINWKGFRRKRLWPHGGTLPPFAWQDWENPQNISVRTASVPAENQTEALPNTNLELTKFSSHCVS
jgi:hypothetical protein